MFTQFNGIINTHCFRKVTRTLHVTQLIHAICCLYKKDTNNLNFSKNKLHQHCICKSTQILLIPKWQTLTTQIVYRDIILSCNGRICILCNKEQTMPSKAALWILFLMYVSFNCLCSKKSACHQNIYTLIFCDQVRQPYSWYKQIISVIRESVTL